MVPFVVEHSAVAIAADAFYDDNEQRPERILVVVELAGGNDGLNTVVPYRNDDYYRKRPTLAAKKKPC